MKLIPLTQGVFAKIDDADFERVNKYKWYYSKISGYALRSFTNQQGKQFTLSMHRFINQTPDGYVTDHRDGDKLNNQKYNLRSCTDTENNQNMRLRKDSQSGYKGVSYNKRCKKWDVRVRTKRVGTFADLLEAVVAYDKKAIEIFGEFAKTNLDWSKDGY